MNTDLREAFRRAAEAVPPLGDAERAVRSGRRRRRAATVAAPLTVLALVGGVWLVGAGSLGGDEPPVADSSPSPVTAADLAGRAFVSSGSVAGLAPGESVVLEFETTRVRANTPCQAGSGNWRLDGNVLVVSDLDGRATCIDNVDGWLGRLTDRPTVSGGSGELLLTFDDTVVRLTESGVQEADATLTGRTWVLQSISDGREFFALPGGFESTLEFDNGTLSIHYGCNTGGGEVAVTDSTLEIGPLDTTEIGCAQPVLTTEQAVQQVLLDDGPLAYAVEGDSLTITGDGGRLVYRATS